MNPEDISKVAGALITIGLAYAPGVAPRFARLDGVQKRLVLGVLVLAVGIGLGLSACYAPYVLQAWQLSVVCSQSDLATLARNVIDALVVSQATYTLLPEGKKNQ